jgi:hypothetical protein
MFSCCFALAILFYLLDVLLVEPAKCLAFLRRASVVFTCDRDITGRLLLARALAQIWHHACHSTDDAKCGVDAVMLAWISRSVATCLFKCLRICHVSAYTNHWGMKDFGLRSRRFSFIAEALQHSRYSIQSQALFRSET